MSSKKAYIGATVPFDMKKEMDAAVLAGKFFSLSELIRYGIKLVLKEALK